MADYQNENRPGLVRGTKIAVAMSGGVDSSVAALLLKEQGFQPVGVTLRFWVDPHATKQPPTEGETADSIRDAGRVADNLGIPHHIVDMEGDFYERVVKYFLQEYKAGRTPNPCIPCNRYLKFSLLLQKIRSRGVNYLATGHYVCNAYNPVSGKYTLSRGVDESKDQSYMLYTLTQKQLTATLFPLGAFTKEEIRRKAREAALWVAEKKDSQEICFIPDNDYRGFLERSDSQARRRGDIVNSAGEKLGEHNGLPFYTVGQRKGLGLTSSRPVYVVGMDPSRNILIVGCEDELYSRGLVAGDLNFISGEAPAGEMQIQVKIRYRAPAVPAVLYPPQNGKASIIFAEKQKAVTPGQAAVFYRGEEVIGGGAIKAIRN